MKQVRRIQAATVNNGADVEIGEGNENKTSYLASSKKMGHMENKPRLVEKSNQNNPCKSDKDCRKEFVGTRLFFREEP